MKLFIALLLSISGFLFAQESYKHINLDMPINYETKTVYNQDPVRPSKGFNYQLVLASVGYAFSALCLSNAFSDDEEARDMVRNSTESDFRSRYAYENRRQEIQETQDARDASYFVSAALFTGATYFLIRYFLN